MNSVFEKFPNQPPQEYIVRGEGSYIFTENGKKILDATAGWCSQLVLGYNHPDVIQSITDQLSKFCHVDHNVWRHHELEDLARLLVQSAPEGLDKAYFCGNSGSESVEAALKLSYQIHHDSGKFDKIWVISREQSYHGSTLQGIATSDRDILDFYKPTLPLSYAKIPEHNPIHLMKTGETLDAYAERCAGQLEQKILEIGQDKVAAFLGETIMGQLQGDVPPAPKYWQCIRSVCDRYDVHLILDEVYCGLGRSGKVYCCEWDEVVPDFICLGKTLAAGYAPLSVVITKEPFEKIIANKQGRVQHGHTHQGHSVGVAAALAVQRIVQTDQMLGHIREIGGHFFKRLKKELGAHPFFVDLRGRGSLISLEFNCANKAKFANEIFCELRDEYDILVSSKWHRISLSPPYILDKKQADRIIDGIVECFKRKAENWPPAGKGVFHGDRRS